MEELKKVFTGQAARIGAGFCVGWVVGRGTATGPQSGEVIIGGLIVALMVTVIVHFLLPKTKEPKK